MSKKITTENFILMANNVHGKKYDYSKVQYLKSTAKIEIICSEHGIFKQTPHIHLGGHGCPKCFGGVKYNQEYFIEKAKIVHNNKYDYSLMKYINWDEKIEIVCTEHGIFIQTPNNHLMGHGCRECFLDTKRIETEKFINKCDNIHNNKYDYSKVKFNCIEDMILISCPEHGEFTQMVSSHINGHGCRLCSNDNLKLEKQCFIDRSNKLHNGIFSYELVKYINNYTPVKILCQTHGIFQQTPKNHMAGTSCPFCREELRKKISPFLKYSQMVNNITYKYKEELYCNWDGYDFYDNELIKENFNLNYNDKRYPTIDHKISKYNGFINGIEPNIIGEINNLCITKRTINSIKNRTNYDDFQITIALNKN
jgi:hypothetical protein